jgi:glutamate/tyrosine decarboxylase-like PLP-dependent enzyme
MTRPMWNDPAQPPEYAHRCRDRRAASAAGSPYHRAVPQPRDPRPPIPPDFGDRFGWHPEPELIGIRDPAASRAALRAVGAATWEAGLDYLYDHALDRAMGEATTFAELRSSYFGPGGVPSGAPTMPTPIAEILRDFADRIAPHTLSAYHPRSFGYFTPPPLVASIAGEVLAQFAQQGVDVWHAGPVAALVEEEVVRWLCDLVGYDEVGFGLLTSGGVMANFIGMTLLRDIQARSILGLDRPPRGRHLEGLRVYTGDQSHFSIGRALDELGFPPETLVTVAADDAFRLRAETVAEAIAEDRRQGLVPIGIAGVAGSTNTGAVDAIDELADLADREGLWLHIDAAYGAGVRLSARDRGRVDGLWRADSVTVDPHKWFFQAYDIGGLMVRRGSALEAVFGGRLPEYYRAGHGSHSAWGVPEAASGVPVASSGGPPAPTAAVSGGPPAPTAAAADPHDAGLNFWKLGFEGTRRWRALKLWFAWRHLGTNGLGRLIEANNDLAADLATIIASSDDFEALPKVPPLSIVCFRHLVPGLTGPALDAHQDALQHALQESGEGWVSTTRLRGATWLRAGILNTQATTEDVAGLIGTIRELAAALD